MAGENVITLSYPTAGPSGAYEPAATYHFVSRGYKPPAQARSIGSDIVHNQNGLFKYVYDNGPGFRTWDTFELVLDDNFQGAVGASATAQWNNLEDLWAHQGSLFAQFPDGVYEVHWAPEKLEKSFIRYPSSVGDKIEYTALVQFEEA